MSSYRDEEPYTNNAPGPPRQPAFIKKHPMAAVYTQNHNIPGSQMDRMLDRFNQGLRVTPPSPLAPHFERRSPAIVSSPRLSKGSAASGSRTPLANVTSRHCTPQAPGTPSRSERKEQQMWALGQTPPARTPMSAWARSGILSNQSPSGVVMGGGTVARAPDTAVSEKKWKYNLVHFFDGVQDWAKTWTTVPISQDGAESKPARALIDLAHGVCQNPQATSFYLGSYLQRPFLIAAIINKFLALRILEQHCNIYADFNVTVAAQYIQLSQAYLLWREHNAGDYRGRLARLECLSLAVKNIIKHPDFFQWGQRKHLELTRQLWQTLVLVVAPCNYDAASSTLARMVETAMIYGDLLRQEEMDWSFEFSKYGESYKPSQVKVVSPIRENPTWNHSLWRVRLCSSPMVLRKIIDPKAEVKMTMERIHKANLLVEERTNQNQQGQTN